MQLFRQQLPFPRLLRLLFLRPLLLPQPVKPLYPFIRRRRIRLFLVLLDLLLLGAFLPHSVPSHEPLFEARADLRDLLLRRVLVPPVTKRALRVTVTPLLPRRPLSQQTAKAWSLRKLPRRRL